MSPNLLWETITYFPDNLFIIEATVKGLRKSLCYDMSHFHFFLESQFGYSNVRDSDFTHCKSFLKSELDNLGLIFLLMKNMKGIPSLKSYDCNT